MRTLLLDNWQGKMDCARLKEEMDRLDKKRTRFENKFHRTVQEVTQLEQENLDLDIAHRGLEQKTKCMQRHLQILKAANDRYEKEKDAIKGQLDKMVNDADKVKKLRTPKELDELIKALKKKKDATKAKKRALESKQSKFVNSSL